MSSTKITTIENAIVKSFKLSVEDFYSNRIEIEEDFRACFYFHLRNIIGHNTDIKILLSHRIKTKKPDIVIRRNDDYIAAIELKNTNKINGEHKDFSTKSGQEDVDKMKLLSVFFQRGYFIYFTKKEHNFGLRKAEWKKGYYREMWHEIDTPSIHVKRFEKDAPIKFTKRIKSSENNEDIF
jgi:hypothetical protein